MALIQMKWSTCQAKAQLCCLLVFLCLHTATGASGWVGCLDGQDVFGSVRENSPFGEVVAELVVETEMGYVHWSLDGKDADWFFLDQRNIRLNKSADKVLDREVQGPFLTASLICNEEDTLQSTYRIIVEILNENDNAPVFAHDTALSLFLSELTPVDTVVFTVQATDEDNDKIIYSIDQTSPDAEYFKIDLPNSGEVILSKSLDYESKNLLTVTIHASEMNTVEHLSTSSHITITVLDGDDQYPQFLPCVLLFQDETSHICTSPVYTVNITEGEEDIVLDFSPGPIRAIDGDRGLRSPVSYAILSGDDDGHFLIDRETGEMKLIQGFRDRLPNPVLHLDVMAFQDDDPRKYSLATVLVRVLAVNHFCPEFDETEYRGFVTAGKSLASLVNTYGNKALMLRVEDQDFDNGFNPMIRLTFSPTSNYTDIYQITQEGLFIAKTNQVKPNQKHILEVMAVDQESGEAASATVLVEVMAEGQLIPHSPLAEERMIGCTVGKALFLSVVFMTALGCVVSMVMWLKKKHKGKRDPLERGCVAQGKHPNVSLRWFQLLNHRNTMPHMEDLPYNNEEYGTYNPSFSYTGALSMYSLQDIQTCPGPDPHRTTTSPDDRLIPTETVRSPMIPTDNVCTPTKHSYRSPSSHPACVDVSQTHTAQHGASPSDMSPESTEALPNTSPTPHDAAESTPCTGLDSETTETTPNDEPADPTTSPSSQSSTPYSQTRIASAEIEKPLCKPCMKPPLYSPLRPSPISRQISTPPPTPDRAPLKAMLVHIDTSVDTPLATPKQRPMSFSDEIAHFSTSLDQMDQSEHEAEAGGASSPPQARRPSTDSGNTQDGHEVGDGDDDGFLGDEDADKNSEGEDELLPEDKELLNVLARCNPTFLTFSK